MSVETVQLEVSDAELFSGATAPEAQETEQPQQEQQGQPRDEQGRFAAKAEPEAPPIQAQPEAVEQKPEPEDAQIPSWRARELREARDAEARKAEEAIRDRYALQQQLSTLQRQLTDLQKPKQEPVDFFQDPNAAFEQRLNPFQDQFSKLASEVRLNSSKALAVSIYGKDAVAEMEQALDQALQSNHPDVPRLSAQMRQSGDPVELAMQWHQREKLVRETGGDLSSYKQKLADELMKDPAFQAKVLEAARTTAGQNPAPKVNLPPSLNRAQGSGGSPSTMGDGDDSDAAIFKYAAASGRR